MEPKSPKQLDFIIGTHAQNDLHAATVISGQRLHAKGHIFFWDIRGAGGAARTRNIICTKFLQEGLAPYLIFLDRDIVFEPDDIQHLLDDLKAGYKLIGGCYAVKDATQLSSYGTLPNGGIALDGKVHEVKWLASGCMAFPKELLRDMVDKLELPLMHKGQWSEAYPFFEQRRFWDGNEWMWLTEDYEFCEKARQVGVKPHIDTRVWVRHIGDYAYTVDEVIAKSARARFAKSLQVEKERIKYAIFDLAEFAGVTQEEALSKVQQAVKHLATNWRAHRKKGGNTEDFYKNNDWYLYDNVHFNSQNGYWKYRMGSLGDIKHSLVMDVGCGMGTAVFVLAHNGNQVIGYDINQRLIDFANFRKDKYKIPNVTFTSDFPVDLIPKLDCVIAIDTLEHIEDLESFMIMLGSHMKQGARFYHASSFGYQDVSPMHFDHSKELPEIMKKAGFLLWADTWFIKS